MALSDQRLTVLEIINEVREKTKLDSVTTITSDSDSLLKLKLLNDVVSEVADHGDWQELLTEFYVTAQSSAATYSISTQASAAGVRVIQNIHEVVFADDTAEMRKTDIDTIRRLQRVGSFGAPKQWSVQGVDSEGNPKISVYPTPASAENGEVFTVLVYSKPPFYTTANGTTRPPFPGKLLVQGLWAKTVLDESDGEPTERFKAVNLIYEDLLTESFNRYNGDTGSTTWFRPGRGRR